MLETLYVKDKKYFDRKCTKKHNCERERERERDTQFDANTDCGYLVRYSNSIYI